MAVTQTGLMSEQEYRDFALGDDAGQWELVDGRLREKPWMSARHGDVLEFLEFVLRGQLDWDAYRVRPHHARTRASADTYYVPDIAVIPAALVRDLLDDPNSLDAYSAPLPLVVEIWSPSTGNYDINEKLPNYQRRGDLEIWHIHPRQRVLTVWRRRADGMYAKSIYHGGKVRPESLPGVEVDLDALFAL